MPTIWIKGKEKTFHLTGSCESWAGEFSTPDAAVDARDCRRIGSFQFEIKTNSKTLLFDVTPEDISGECIQCGQCCSHPRKACPNYKDCTFIKDGKYHICEHLEVIYANGGIGKPGGTRCRIYDRILIEGRKECVMYPSDGTDMKPACGLRFE